MVQIEAIYEPICGDNVTIAILYLTDLKDLQRFATFFKCHTVKQAHKQCSQGLYFYEFTYLPG